MLANTTHNNMKQRNSSFIRFNLLFVLVSTQFYDTFLYLNSFIGDVETVKYMLVNYQVEWKR